MNRKSFGTLAAGAIALSPFPAFAASNTVRLGDLPIEADGQPYYADQLGLFKKAGLDVEVISITNGAAILSGVLGGSMEIGVSNIISLASAYKRGIKIACVSGSSLYTSKAPTSALMVSNGSVIRAARDLSGKTIAVNGLRNITQLAAMAWIDKNGGDSASVKFVELSFPEMIPAVSQGRVDAVLVAEPAVSSAKGSARILGYPYDAVAPRFLLGCFFTTTAYLAQNQQTVKRIVDVLRAAGNWANQHHSESGQMLAAVTKIDVNVIQNMTRATYPDKMLISDVQPVIDLAAKYGVIAESFPAAEIIWNG